MTISATGIACDARARSGQARAQADQRMEPQSRSAEAEWAGLLADVGS